MRQIIYLSLLLSVFISCKKDEDTKVNNTTIKADSVTMGAQYANDIYYSMENGIVSSPVRTEWDIAFYTDPRSSSILINDGKGMKLYLWKGGDKENWSTVDTAGMLQGPYFNVYNDTTWENGAFDQEALGHPDYGWGVYDMNSHSVFGDSIYVLIFADNTAKKIFIEKRQASDNAYYFKYANLDGTGEKSEVLPITNYLNRNMIHYSISNQAVVVHEPLKTAWDFMFTKYRDNVMDYVVTGVLSNNSIGVAKVENVDTALNTYSTASYSKVISTIGYDWKAFNMDTYQYEITDSLVYFVKNRNSQYYKLVFTGFGGGSTGKFLFVKTSY